MRGLLLPFQVAKEVAEMLRHNRGLCSLDLRNNRLGKAGLMAIAEGVQVCCFADVGRHMHSKPCCC